RFRFSGVMRLIVPSSSSFPQRPQLLRLAIILITSLSVRVVATGVLLAGFGPEAESGLEVLERHRLTLHPEPELRHEDEIGMRALGHERVAVTAEEHTRERQSRRHLARRLPLEKKKPRCDLAHDQPHACTRCREREHAPLIPR